ncbi:nuclear transport factor 2 family protein [Natrinema gelatinilyticum]|uniref:nuclear transport factor 2 family protein n=1 Tax=Natrinema gelatinilyticum TaxID=2961571 RepID=UPI0020C3D539|nr:nuclear transport factor 2 family protein [Natrinema gelatinilyticum]
MSDTNAVLDHHLDAFANQELKEILADYSDDSVVITNMGVFRGLDEIEELFTDLFDEFAQEGSTLEVDDTIVEDEFAYLLWHAETPDNTYEFCTDTFYIPEETIDFQTFAGKAEPKN